MNLGTINAVRMAVDKLGIFTDLVIYMTTISLYGILWYCVGLYGIVFRDRVVEYAILNYGQKQMNIRR